jgi:hypothetical protein
MSSEEKTLEVEAADEGPRIRPKRQMTEAQLAALKKGRAKLAEKRKQQREEALEVGSETTSGEEPSTTETRSAKETETQTEDVSNEGEELTDEDLNNGYLPCVVM